jgi:hypothetical protein
MIAGREYYYTAHGQLPGVRETQSNLNEVPWGDRAKSDGGAPAPAR